MTLFCNNNHGRFGDGGPYEAENKEALANDMRSKFNKMAYREFDETCKPMSNDEYLDYIGDMSNDQVIEEIAKRIRSEFIAGVEICSPNNNNNNNNNKKMKVYTIPLIPSGVGSIHDIRSTHYDREIKFRCGAKYAVVLAAYYGRNQYTIHQSASTAAKMSQKQQKIRNSHKIIDTAGNTYTAYGDELMAD